MLRSEGNDQVTMDWSGRSNRQDQPSVSGLCERLDPSFDLGSVAEIDGKHLQPERRRDRLNHGKLPGEI